MRTGTAAFWLVFWLISAGCDPSPPPADCYGVCGDGTQCEAGRCVVAGPADPPAAAEPSKSKKRGARRGRKRNISEPAAAGSSFTPEDDSRVPEYAANAGRTLDMKAGTERLADRTVNKHLRQLEGKFNACISTSAEHYEGTLSGELDFTIGIEPSGKVAGVSVKGSKSLRDSGVVPCARNVVHRHRFPSFDGQTMGVDYSFKVN